MVAEPILETADLRRSRKQLKDDKTFSDYNIPSESDTISIDDEHVVNTVEEKRIPSPKRRSTRVTKAHQGSAEEYADKVVDVSVAMQRQFLQIQTMHKKSWRRRPTSRFGLDLRYCERAC